MTLKTIKNIREEKWAELKSIAAKEHIPIGKLVENMIDSYTKYAGDFWNEILYGEKHLSDKEAAEMKKVVAELRNEKWFKHESHS